MVGLVHPWWAWSIHGGVCGGVSPFMVGLLVGSVHSWWHQPVHGGIHGESECPRLGSIHP